MNKKTVNTRERMSLRIRSAAVACTLLVSTALLAAPPAVTAGTYIAEGGWGHLTLEENGNGAFRFSIQAVGANGHMCELEGILRNGKATLEGPDESSPCIVTMKPGADGIEIDTNGRDACGGYCGARAGFTGLYSRPAPACLPGAVAATRKTFQQLYDAKRYANARRKLEPLLGQCEPWMDWLTVGWVRNDLAITLYKLDDRAACRAALEPLREDAELTDEELHENYPPSDAESWLPIIRAARTNLRLCRQK